MKQINVENIKNQSVLYAEEVPIRMRLEHSKETIAKAFVDGALFAMQLLNNNIVIPHYEEQIDEYNLDDIVNNSVDCETTDDDM